MLGLTLLDLMHVARDDAVSQCRCHLCLTFLAGCSGPSTVGFESPRDGGYGFHLSALDGRGGLAARRPATTRPLIERCDLIAV